MNNGKWNVEIKNVGDDGPIPSVFIGAVVINLTALYTCTNTPRVTQITARARLPRKPLGGLFTDDPPKTSAEAVPAGFRALVRRARSKPNSRAGFRFRPVKAFNG